jgi:23S rRNA pseudouridine955/2504/2580 synthase
MGLGALYGAIRRGKIRVNGKKVQGDYRVQMGDQITMDSETDASISDGSAAARSAGERSGYPRLEPRRAASYLRPLILWESEDYLVLNKPRGALVHGEESLDEYVKAYLFEKTSPSLSFSPGPLHRLDRNTTGVLFFSKSITGARVFSEALQKRKALKKYFALLEGKPTDSPVWRDTLTRLADKRTARSHGEGPAGKAAETEVRPLLFQGTYALCLVTLHTGRTHQIRAQASAHGHPLAGDKKYGGRPFPGGYILHAAEFTLYEGEGPDKRPLLSVKAPLPTGVREKLAALFGKKIEDLLL